MLNATPPSPRSLTNTRETRVESTGSIANDMPILISVREISEIESVLPIGVDVIDLKEPSRGPLAATEVAIWEQVAERFIRHPENCRSSWSVALGEIVDAEPLAMRCPPEFDFAKAAPRGIANIETLRECWGNIAAALPSSVRFVPVAYADDQHANCPPPIEILDSAVELGFQMILVDTCNKNFSVTEHLQAIHWTEMVQKARQSKVQLMLAGGLQIESAMHLAVDPDRRPLGFGFRGGVCGGDRQSSVQSDLVQHLIDRRNEVMQLIQTTEVASSVRSLDPS